MITAGFLVATTVHSIVDPIVDPDIGIKVRHIGHQLAVLITWGHFMRLAPLIQVVVEGVGNPVPIGSLTMIDHSWPAVFGDKTGAAEHTVPHGCRSQHSGVPFPVYHIFAGNMGENKTSPVPVNVVQVVTPLPEEGRVGVARDCVSRPEMGEVVSQPGFWQALWYGRGLDDVFGSWAVHTELIRVKRRSVRWALFNRFIACSLLILFVDGFPSAKRDSLDLQVSTLTEQTNVKVIGIIVMPPHGGLTLVGKDLDQVLVDEDEG